jgi:hypothetical protein
MQNPSAARPSTPLRQRIAQAEAEIERINGIIAKIDTALALPICSARDPKQAAQLSKARAGASALQRAKRLAGGQFATGRGGRLIYADFFFAFGGGLRHRLRPRSIDDSRPAVRCRSRAGATRIGHDSHPIAARIVGRLTLSGAPIPRTVAFGVAERHRSTA